MLPRYGSNSGLKWLDPYEYSDAPFFPFRSLNTTSIINDLFESHLIVLHGDSGSGKTSFIQAQLIPALELSGARCTIVRSINDPIFEIISGCLNHPSNKFTEELRSLDLSKVINQQFQKNSQDWVLILDPLEHLIFNKKRTVCEKLFQELNRILKMQLASRHANFHIVMSIRSDFLQDLSTFTVDFPLLDTAPKYHLTHLNEPEIKIFLETFSRITNIHLSPNLVDYLISSSEKFKLRTLDFQLIICHLFAEVVKIHGRTVGTVHIEMDYDQFLQLGSVPIIIREFLNKEIEIVANEIQATKYYSQSISNLSNNLSVFRIDSLLRRCIRLVLFCFISHRKSAVNSSCRSIIFQVLKDESGIPKKWILQTILSLVKHGLFKRVPEKPNSLELANSSLSVSILNWIDSSIDILEIIDAQLIFKHTFSECISENRLMTIDELNETTKNSDRLGFSTEELILLFQSSLTTAQHSKKWFNRLKSEYISTSEIIDTETIKSNYQKRINLVKGLFHIGPEVVTVLHTFLKDDYPQVRANAVAALDVLDSSGDWRQFLYYETFVGKGPFLMGTNKGNFADEGPQHTIDLEEYYIGLTPVTYSDFKLYMDEIEEPFDITPGRERHPMSGLTWFQIQEYVRWASSRLPTEPEWEKAASWHASEKIKRQYPWGNLFDETSCNMRAGKLNTTTPVGRYSPTGDSFYGCKDMAGNIWEWTNSIFSPYPYNSLDGREEKSKSGSRVIRGGSFECGATYVTCTVRLAFDPYSLRADLGFRTVLQIPDINDW